MVTIDTTSSQCGSTAPQPVDVRVCPFVVLVDSREQQPWTFQGLIRGDHQLIVRQKTVCLPTGDYSIEGCESHIAIERKSADDLVGSVCGGHDRFEREHYRMQAIVEAGGVACVVCEGSLAAMCDELEADGRWKAARTLLGCAASWPFKFHVPWYFAGIRRQAEILALAVLMRWWEKKENGMDTH